MPSFFSAMTCGRNSQRIACRKLSGGLQPVTGVLVLQHPFKIQEIFKLIISKFLEIAQNTDKFI
jgi:hypothetical protein